ncbi:hypothetical protein TNCV_2930271 [Trichonephila clavipes]|nr:hypothetical protein TNCV_2930271 [Trichonephila clavipes]
MTATAGSDVVQSGRPIFDDFFQHLWPYIGNNTANVVFQMVKQNLEKKKLCLQETLDLFQNLPPEISDVPADESSDEEVPANYLLELSLDS